MGDQAALRPTFASAASDASVVAFERVPHGARRTRQDENAAVSGRQRFTTEARRAQRKRGEKKRFSKESPMGRGHTRHGENAAVSGRQRFTTEARRPRESAEKKKRGFLKESAPAREKNHLVSDFKRGGAELRWSDGRTFLPVQPRALNPTVPKHKRGGMLHPLSG